jgi:thiol-disulfide isomerase/thioredoxin
VLLDFWASWCIPCRFENPTVIKAYDRFKHKNFTVLSVSLEKPGDRKAWVAAIIKDKLTWPQVATLTSEENSKVSKLYGIQAIPMNFLIDPQGKIVAVHLRGEALIKKLEEIL